ncbi:alpha/beta hydrolase family protein [Yunchengibacter salinarum]|uniref:alpha/beta hydrolase family protein n=1 Tax=Yunchengibacter salinarum TaxID=3133399 RepID=UPI0035B6A873
MFGRDRTLSADSVRINVNADHSLDAILDRPAKGTPRHYAVFAHCFTCSKSFKTTAHLSKALAGQGLGVLRLDFSGLGKSDGDFADTNFTTNVRDLLAAVDWLRTHYRAPALIFGHSFGGTVAMAAAADVPEAVGVASINAPFEPEHVAHVFGDRLDDIVEKGSAQVDLAGRSFQIKKQFLEDIENQRMGQRVRDLDAHVLIFHAPMDATVGVENARYIYEAAKHPKSFLSLDGADHFLRDSRDADYVGEVLGAWVRRHLD